MVSPIKHYDFIASRDRPSQAQRSKNRFRTGIAKCHALVPGHFAEHLRDLAGERRLRTGFKAQVKLLFYRFLDEFGVSFWSYSPSMGYSC